MPLFGKKQSEEARKKMEHKLYLARESRDVLFDLSQCELIKVPGGVYSLCKVLMKETLLLNENFLHSICGAGKFTDLENLKNLDLHGNAITELPEEIKHLRCLQNLNLGDNKVSKLPTGFSQLKNLHNLNLKKNKLKVVPSEICQLPKLRFLDISGNKVSQLPTDLCQIRTLETLTLSHELYTYPEPNICEKGTEAIMQFLCEKAGVEYEAPCVTIDNSLTENCFDSSNLVDGEPVQIMQYDRLKDEKRKRLMDLERQMTDQIKVQAEMASKASHNKSSVLDKKVQDEQRLLGELDQLQRQRESERRRMVVQLSETQNSADDLVKHLMDLSVSGRNREEVMEALERDRMEKEKWFLVRHEESDSLRRSEVLGNMRQLLALECDAYSALLQKHQENRQSASKRVQACQAERETTLESAIKDKRTEQSDLFHQLAKEEELQKAAFAQLQMQKDVRSQRIGHQIVLIERELRMLTEAEMARRQERHEGETCALAARRGRLISLFSQLHDEKRKREHQLKQMMTDMESQRDQRQNDYWLIQFQRLLDRKPQSLIDQESNMEIAVLEILRKAQAEVYLPQFQRHRITIETLLQMTDENFVQIGVHIYGTRQSLHAAIKEYKKLNDFMSDDNLSTYPSAPPTPLPKVEKETDPDNGNEAENNHSDEEGACIRPSAPPQDPIKPPPRDSVAHIEQYCCVCFEKESVVLFLECGHICCCWRCAQSIITCPLCREDITQRIRLQS